MTDQDAHHELGELRHELGDLRNELTERREAHAAMAREVDELRQRMDTVQDLLNRGEPVSEAQRLARILLDVGTGR